MTSVWCECGHDFFNHGSALEDTPSFLKRAIGQVCWVSGCKCEQFRPVSDRPIDILIENPQFEETSR